MQGEDHAYAVRYPRGKALYRPAEYRVTRNAFDVYGDPDAKIAIVTYGRLFSFAAEAVEKLAGEGISCRLIKLNRIIPLDEAAVQAVLDCDTVFFFEESIRAGGVAEYFGSVLCSDGYRGSYEVRALESGFVHHAPMFRTLEKLGLDRDGIYRTVCEKMRQGENKE